MTSRLADPASTAEVAPREQPKDDEPNVHTRHRGTVVTVPDSLKWKWYDDVRSPIPKFRVVVIGSRHKKIARGARAGLCPQEPALPRTSQSNRIGKGETP